MQCLSCQTDNPPANRFCDQRVSVGVAEALAWIDRAVSIARSTGSEKYLGKCQPSGASTPSSAGAGTTPLTELGQSLAIGRKIQAPDLALRQTFLAWQRVVAAREDLHRLIRV